MAKEKNNKGEKLLLLIAVIVLVVWLLRRIRAKENATNTTKTEPVNSFSSSSYSSSNVSTVPTSSEIETATTNLTGIAPTGKKWGINTNSGQVFYVDTAGDWQPYDAPVSSNLAITGTYAAVHLDNSQSFTSDVTMTGVLLANHYDLTVTTDLEALQGVDVLINVVANNKVRVTVRNNTGNTVSIPQLTISALQLN